MNERLYSLNESRLLINGQGLAATHRDDQEKKILDTGKEHFTYRAKNYKAARLGEERSSAVKLADDCMAAGAGEQGLGKMIYQLLSGRARGGAYALQQLPGDTSTPHGPDTPRGDSAAGPAQRGQHGTKAPGPGRRVRRDVAAVPPAPGLGSCRMAGGCPQDVPGVACPRPGCSRFRWLLTVLLVLR